MNLRAEKHPWHTRLQQKPFFKEVKKPGDDSRGEAQHTHVLPDVLAVEELVEGQGGLGGGGRLWLQLCSRWRKTSPSFTAQLTNSLPFLSWINTSLLFTRSHTGGQQLVQLPGLKQTIAADASFPMWVVWNLCDFKGTLQNHPSNPNLFHWLLNHKWCRNVTQNETLTMYLQAHLWTSRRPSYLCWSFVSRWRSSRLQISLIEGASVGTLETPRECCRVEVWSRIPLFNLSRLRFCCISTDLLIRNHLVSQRFTLNPKSFHSVMETCKLPPVITC